MAFKNTQEKEKYFKKWNKENPNYFIEWRKKAREKLMKFRKEMNIATPIRITRTADEKRITLNRQMREYRLRNKIKVRARKKVEQAIMAGKLKKLPCEKCGKNAEAHHPDYSKPLVVQWLCKEHHVLEHWR